MTRMATRRNWFAIRYIQLRRRYARDRLLREMGWRTGWAK